MNLFVTCTKMSYLGILVLLLISNFAFSQICLTQNPCECVLPNKTVINLSPVGLPNHPRFHDVLFDLNCSELYSYNPCFPFNSPDKDVVTNPTHTPCTGASVCVKNFGGSDGKPPEVHAIGLQNSAVFGMENGQFYINYNINPSSKQLRVNLNCSNDSDVPNLTMEDLKCSDDGPIVLTLTSKCACPDGCLKTTPEYSSPGLSTGSKLLIAFFTLLVAYFIIGMVWNYCNGSQGMELIPNIEFWNDLPTLIMEGVVFTCSCCGRQRSYGEV